MSFEFRADPDLIKAVKAGANVPSQWDDRLLKIVGGEFRVAQDFVIGTGSSTEIGLPMPNLLYVALNLMSLEARPSSWRLFRLLGELQRELERECLTRFLEIDRDGHSRTASAVIEALAEPIGD